MQWWILGKARPHIYSNYCFEINKWDWGRWEEMWCVIFFLASFSEVFNSSDAFHHRVLFSDLVFFNTRLETPQTWHHHFELFFPFFVLYNHTQTRRIISRWVHNALLMLGGTVVLSSQQPLKCHLWDIQDMFFFLLFLRPDRVIETIVL